MPDVAFVFTVSHATESVALTLLNMKINLFSATSTLLR